MFVLFFQGNYFLSLTLMCRCCLPYCMKKDRPFLTRLISTEKAMYINIFPDRNNTSKAGLLAPQDQADKTNSCTCPISLQIMDSSLPHTVHFPDKSCKQLFVWQRFCEPARLRIAYCPSMRVLWESSCCYWAAHCMGIVNWYWLLIHPFARQAVCWGPFIAAKIWIFYEITFMLLKGTFYWYSTLRRLDVFPGHT